jgi:hypothetical protein
MGFLIQISDDTRTMLNRLRTHPAEVLGKPYGGYILFLVGGADTEALAWLQNNILALDSLTADILAYAIFAKRFNIEYAVTGKAQRIMPKSTHRRAIPPEVMRLVKSGILGWEMDGNEITAVTYAVDEIARQFGVLAELPCMIILDALPTRDMEVIHLSDTTTDRVIPTLRQAIAAMLQVPTYDVFMDKVRRLYELQKLLNESERLSRDLERQQLELNNRIVQQCIFFDAYYQEFLSGARASLVRAHLRGFRALVAKLLLELGRLIYSPWGSFAPSDPDYLQFERALQRASELREVLAAYEGTAYRLNALATRFDWPLSPDDYVRYATIYNKHVTRLIGGLPPCSDTDTRDNCLVLEYQLRAKLEDIITEILEGLPNKEGLLARIKGSEDKRRTDLTQKLEQITKTRLSLEQEVKILTAELVRMEKPSLIASISSISRKQHLTSFRRQLKDTTITFANGWLRPELLLEILK